MFNFISGRRSVIGHLHLFEVQHCTWIPITRKPLRNNIMYDWATAAQQLFRGTPDGLPYHINCLYVEFDNSGAPVSPEPTVTDLGETLAYYDGLSADPNRDYLRAAVNTTEYSSSDLTKYPRGNVATFIGITSGALGVHGKTFSDAAGSRVYGAALVASPDDTDFSQDLVVARIYLAAANQIEKIAGSQIGLQWSLTFK